MTTRNSLLNQPCLRKFKTLLMSSRKFKRSWWRIVGEAACAGFWRQRHRCAHDIDDMSKAVRLFLRRERVSEGGGERVFSATCFFVSAAWDD
ncbi:hypothetical protein L484_013692 [Morus notabilis]|uniref:Uncharacterized protein n=1 Tax=Morus notabilis TaxID=981085 RepID=W9QFN5_9ROSA|nr:hypothetical protein L484_013692 [Morus notabilis]